jgi:TRAP-type C4-dicarboxylate transport system permease small subunit
MTEAGSEPGAQRRAGARLVDGGFRLLDMAVVAALALMSVLVFGNVVLRYAFNSGIDVSEELSRMLLVWVIFVGAVIAFRERAHLGVDTLTRRLPLRAQLACFVASECVMAFICLLIFDGSLRQARINWDNAAPVTGLSLAIGYGMSMFMSAAILAMIAHKLVLLAAGRLRPADLQQVQESEEAAKIEQAVHSANLADELKRR